MLSKSNRASKSLQENALTLYYLFHSCFCAATSNLLMVFDYPSSEVLGLKRHLVNSVLAEVSEGREVIVFFSHSHGDHYGKEFAEALSHAAEIVAVASEDVIEKDGAFLERVCTSIIAARPHATYRLRHVVVETLRSTDLGVAYIVRVGQTVLYHSGDLARWVWPDFPDELKAAIDSLFRRELERLAKHRVDVAMAVAEPRLPGWGGLDLLLENVKPRFLVPAHLWGKADLSALLAEQFQSKYPYTQIVTYSREGEKILG